MLLLPYASILLAASALKIPLQPRGEREDTQDNQLVYNDGPTADGTAGIGAEFESPFFRLHKKDCSLQDSNAAKKSLIEGRKGPNWELTADSTGAAGELQAEYILDGRNIKVGSEDGAKAGKAIADDLIGWAPWKGNGPQTLNIDNNKCNPWDIKMSQSTKPESLPWSPQITAPMPLEALYVLMEENLADPNEKNVLDGDNFRFPRNKLVLVKKEYFQSKPNNIDESKITNDVLAFCTLVLSYAKAATQELKPDQSPKLFISFMPRTEFNTMYELVKPKLTGDLFSLFNTLACYKTDTSGTVGLDTDYCKGTTSTPVPGDKFSGLKFTNLAPEPAVVVNIKDWIQGIGKGDPSPDLLSKFDQSIDGSIGGLGTKMEKMYNSQRAAPLIEFRDLAYKQITEVEQFMKDVDSAIQKFHQDFADAPTMKKSDVPGCTQPAAATQYTTPTQPNPLIVAPVDPPSQPSCTSMSNGLCQERSRGRTGEGNQIILRQSRQRSL
ncbi:MAG: hypothetical protein Q9181_005769 [Wetmoreana brouardii]